MEIDTLTLGYLILKCSFLFGMMIGSFLLFVFMILEYLQMVRVSKLFKNKEDKALFCALHFVNNKPKRYNRFYNKTKREY